MSRYRSGFHVPAKRSMVGGRLSSFLPTATVPGIDLVDRPDLVREVHPLECDHTLADAEAAEVLAVSHDVPGDAREPGALHCAAQQPYTRSAPSRGPR